MARETVLETAAVLLSFLYSFSVVVRCLRSFPHLLNGFECGELEAVDAGVESLRDFSNQPMERCSSDEELGGLLVLADLSQGNRACCERSVA